MSKFGGAGSPDTHDTEGTLAGNLRKAFNTSSLADQTIARISLRNYALSVLACNSSYMQMGYEYCNEKQNGVFRGQVSPDNWTTLREKRAGQAQDISGQIRAINALKESLHVENCRVVFKECSEKQNGYLAKIHCEFIDVDTNKKTAEIVLVMNKKPERGAVALTDAGLLALEKSGLEKQTLQAVSGIETVMIYHTPIAAQHSPLEKKRKPPAMGW